MLTATSVLDVGDVSDADAAAGNAHSRQAVARAAREGAECVTVSAAVEAETALLAETEEHAPLLESVGPQEPGLDRAIRARPPAARPHHLQYRRRHRARGGERGAQEAGRIRVEGGDYSVQGGDVTLFRFNL